MLLIGGSYRRTGKWLSEEHLREGAGVRIIISLSTFCLRGQRDGTLVVNKATHSPGAC